jgi:hypothetical protein
MFSELYPRLFAHIFGESESFSVEYYCALVENGILKKDNEQFGRKRQVWLEARNDCHEVTVPCLLEWRMWQQDM